MPKKEKEQISIDVFRENLRDSKAVREYFLKNIKEEDIFLMNKENISTLKYVFDSVFYPIFQDKDMNVLIRQNKDKMWTPYCFFKVGEKSLFQHMKDSGMMDKILQAGDDVDNYMKTYILKLITDPTAKLSIDFYELKPEKNIYEKYNISIRDEKTKPDIIRRFDLISDRLDIALQDEEYKRKYAELYDSLKLLSYNLYIYCTPDQNGQFTLLGMPELIRLREQYKALKTACDKVAEMENLSINDQQVKLIAESIKKSLVADGNILDAFNFSGVPKHALYEILDWGRNKYAASNELLNYKDITADRQGVKNPDTIILKKSRDEQAAILKGSYNSRNALSYDEYDISGNKKKEGFFTSSIDYSLTKKFKEIYDNMIDMIKNDNRPSRKLKKIVGEVLERLYTYTINDPLFKDVEYGRNGLIKIGYKEEEINYLLSSNQLTVNEKQDIKYIFDKYIEDIRIINAKNMTVSDVLNPDIKSTIDKRNIIMYKMGCIFGIDNVIARTGEMILVDGNKTTYGTFMDRAPGNNISDLYDQDERVILPKGAFDNTMALRDIAEIQILDYIGLNTDRNMYNIYFKYSGDPVKCQSAVAIDNDNSLGKKVPKENERLDLLPSLEGIKAISKRMSERILSISEDSFINTLKGNGLSSKEIAAALNRFDIIRNRIKLGLIETLEDSQWEKMKLADLSDKDHPNYFNSISDEYYDELIINARLVTKDDIKEPEVNFLQTTRISKVSEENIDKKINEDKKEEKKNELIENILKPFIFYKSNSRMITDQEMARLYRQTAERMYDRVYRVYSWFNSKTQMKAFYRAVKDMRDDAVNLEQQVRRGHPLSEGDIRRAINFIYTMNDKGMIYETYKEKQVYDERRRNRDTETERLNAVEYVNDNSSNLINSFREVWERKKMESCPEDILFQLIEDKMNRLKEQSRDQNDIGEFRNNLAALIYLNAVRSHVVSLNENGTLVDALMKNKIAEQAEKIKNSPEFIAVIRNNRNDLIKIASVNNGWKLLDLYAGAAVEPEELYVAENNDQHNIMAEQNEEINVNTFYDEAFTYVAEHMQDLSKQIGDIKINEDVWGSGVSEYIKNIKISCDSIIDLLKNDENADKIVTELKKLWENLNKKINYFERITRSVNIEKAGNSVKEVDELFCKTNTLKKIIGLEFLLRFAKKEKDRNINPDDYVNAATDNNIINNNYIINNNIINNNIINNEINNPQLGRTDSSYSVFKLDSDWKYKTHFQYKNILDTFLEEEICETLHNNRKKIKSIESSLEHDVLCKASNVLNRQYEEKMIFDKMDINNIVALKNKLNSINVELNAENMRRENGDAYYLADNNVYREKLLALDHNTYFRRHCQNNPEDYLESWIQLEKDVNDRINKATARNQYMSEGDNAYKYICSAKNEDESYRRLAEITLNKIVLAPENKNLIYGIEVQRINMNKIERYVADYFKKRNVLYFSDKGIRENPGINKNELRTKINNNHFTNIIKDKFAIMPGEIRRQGNLNNQAGHREAVLNVI